MSILQQRIAAPRRYNRSPPGGSGPGASTMSSTAAKKARPKYLSLPAILFEIRLPLPGWVSILHRFSGALLFPFAAWLLYLLDASLRPRRPGSTQIEALPADCRW